MRGPAQPETDATLCAVHAARRVFVRHLTNGTLTARRKVDKGDSGDAGLTKGEAKALEVSHWLREYQGTFVNTLLVMLKHAHVAHRVSVHDLWLAQR